MVGVFLSVGEMVFDALVNEDLVGEKVPEIFSSTERRN